MGIPMELISMGASTVLGGILGIMAQNSKDKAEQQKMLMARADFQSKQFDKARNVTDQFTISLRQEQIYGGEQEYNLNISSITIAGLDNNTSRRWSNLQNERKRFKAPKYVRTNNKK